MLKRAFGLLAFLTLLSRFSGFIRVAIFASFFGSGPESDVFLTALFIPELMYRFLSEGLISSAAVPIFVRQKANPGQLQKSFWSIFWTVTAVSSVPIIGLEIFAEPLCRLLVPGFSEPGISNLAHLWRIIAPYVLLSAQAAVMAAFLNARNHFAGPGLGPLVVNGTIIAGILMANGGNLESIALSVSLGAVFQLIWLGWLTRGQGLVVDRALSRASFCWDVIREFAANVAPISLWIFLMPIVPVYERYLLSSQAVGSVSVLNYNEKLINLPLGIISISLATVLFPSMSEADEERRDRLLGAGLWALVAMLIPIFLVIQAGSDTLVDVVLRRGRFSVAETALTAEFFRNYSFWILPSSVCLVLNRAFFARGNFRLPFFAGLLAIMTNILFDGWMVQHVGPSGVGFGAALAAAVQMILLFSGLAWTSGRNALLWSLPPILAALLAFPLVKPVALALAHLNIFFSPSGKWSELLLLAGLGAFLQMLTGGIGAYFWRKTKVG